MRITQQRGTTVALVLASHPVKALVFTVVLAGAAALTGRSGEEVALVAATVLTGQVILGWLNDVVDRNRDRAAGRERKPVALGWVDPGTVTFTIACAVLLVVPLSVSNGTYAGIAHLGFLLLACTHDLLLRRTALSWLPWAAGFAMLPAFLSYGGYGGGLHGGPPTIAMTVLAGLLGIGVHVLLALPHLVEDNQNGLRHLPLRIALRVGAAKLLWLSTAYTVVVTIGLVAVGLGAGVTQ